MHPSIHSRIHPSILYLLNTYYALSTAWYFAERGMNDRSLRSLSTLGGELHTHSQFLHVLVEIFFRAPSLSLETSERRRLWSCILGPGKKGTKWRAFVAEEAWEKKALENERETHVQNQ